MHNTAAFCAWYEARAKGKEMEDPSSGKNSLVRRGKSEESCHISVVK